jgi:hypothetical protein
MPAIHIPHNIIQVEDGVPLLTDKAKSFIQSAGIQLTEPVERELLKAQAAETTNYIASGWSDYS